MDELISSLLLQVQTIAESNSCIPTSDGGASSCPASVFNAVTAAFATQGYWAHSDVLYHINNTGFASWAMLIYLIGAVMGIIKMALGSPPKDYIWFFIGPGIYHWLVQDTIPVSGVRWYVGPVKSNRLKQEAAQQEVWKLAEVGLSAKSVDESSGFRVFRNIGNAATGGRMGIDIGKVQVSQMMVWAHSLLTDFNEWMIRGTGVFQLPSNESSVFSSAVSALPPAVVRTASASGVFSVINNFLKNDDRSEDMHWTLSNLKWQYMMNITGARIGSGVLRKVITEFFYNECGRAFRKGMDEGAYTAARNAKGANIPNSMFLNSGPGCGRYELLTKYLATHSVPAPMELKDFLEKDAPGSFRQSVAFLSSKESGYIYDQIRCDQYLHIINHALRWEAGHIYYQMINGLPKGVTPLTLMYTLFYGWPVHNLEIDDFFQNGAGLNDIGTLWSSVVNGFNPSTLVREYTPVGQAAFMTDLILVHLYRNEIINGIELFDAHGAEGVVEAQKARTYMADTGSRARFGEVYTYTTILPYVQGVLMYLLFLGYPVICICILYPGWQKILVTWLSFLVWVMLWDPFFAIANVIERSVWAMVGNNSDAVKMFSKVWSMQDQAMTKVSCGGLGGQLGTFSPPYTVCAPGQIPSVYVGNSNGLGNYLTGIPGANSVFQGINNATQGTFAGSAQTDFVPWLDSLTIMDKAMVLGSAMDLDLANSKYIYIMTFIYFAVPAISGNLVLGAKSGIANLATQALQGASSSTGSSLASSFQQRMSSIAQTNQKTAREAAYGMALRDGQNAQQALEMTNQALLAGSMASANSKYSGILGQASRMVATANQQAEATNSHAGQLVSGVVYGLGGVSSAFGGSSVAGVLKRVPGAKDVALAGFGIAPSVGQLYGVGAQDLNYGLSTANRMRQMAFDSAQAGANVAEATYSAKKDGMGQFSDRSMQIAHAKAEKYASLVADSKIASSTYGAVQTFLGGTGASLLSAQGVNQSLLAALGVDEARAAERDAIAYGDPNSQTGFYAQMEPMLETMSQYGPEFADQAWNNYSGGTISEAVDNISGNLHRLLDIGTAGGDSLGNLDAGPIANSGHLNPIGGQENHNPINLADHNPYGTPFGLSEAAGGVPAFESLRDSQSIDNASVSSLSSGLMSGGGSVEGSGATGASASALSSGDAGGAVGNAFGAGGGQGAGAHPTIFNNPATQSSYSEGSPAFGSSGSPAAKPVSSSGPQDSSLQGTITANSGLFGGAGGNVFSGGDYSGMGGGPQTIAQAGSGGGGFFSAGGSFGFGGSESLGSTGSPSSQPTAEAETVNVTAQSPNGNNLNPIG